MVYRISRQAYVTAAIISVEISLMICWAALVDAAVVAPWKIARPISLPPSDYLQPAVIVAIVTICLQALYLRRDVYTDDSHVKAKLGLYRARNIRWQDVQRLIVLENKKGEILKLRIKGKYGPRLSIENVVPLNELLTEVQTRIPADCEIVTRQVKFDAGSPLSAAATWALACLAYTIWALNHG